MATNTENIGLTETGLQLLDELLGAMVGNTQIIQEIQEALNAVKKDHDENTSLSECLDRIAKAKGQFQENHEVLTNSKTFLETFLERLQGMQE